MSVQAIISSATGFRLGSNVMMMALVENKTVSGRIKKLGYQYTLPYCSYWPATEDTEIIDVTKWNLKWLVLTTVPALFDSGCIQTWGCTAGGTGACPSWDSSAGSYQWGIPIIAQNTSVPGLVPSFNVTPLSGAIGLTWEAVADPSGLSEVFAYDIYVYDGATLVASGFADAGQRSVGIGGLTNGKTYTVKIRAVSHNGVPGQYSSKTAIPVGATNPVVYRVYTAPESPKAGESMTITAEIANMGPGGKVRAVFKVGGTQISDQNSTLVPFEEPGRVLWKPTATYTMPNATITITIEAYGWDGSMWVLTDTFSFTRTPAVTPCSGMALDPFTASIKAGEKVTLTAAVTPATTQFDVQFKDRAGTVLGTCKTSGGSCTFVWDSTGKAPGTYYVKAYVSQGTCASNESIIQVSPAIGQWYVNIYVRDSSNNQPVQGADVTVGTQTKQTDATGYVQFRVDQGQIYITISKSGYSTFTTTESVFSDKTFNYTLSPVGAAKGSVQFVSVPSGAEIFLGDADQGKKTPFTVTDIPAGKHTFTLKLAGYNDATGEVEVIGGSVIQVYVALSPATPTTGSLYATSMPLGAEIFIGDTDQKVDTPAMVTNLTAGSHAVKLTKTGYQDWTGTVNIVAGKTQYINPTLTPLTTTGSLEINSVPPGARVYLDDKDQQKVTPAAITNLTAGSHPYKLVLAGYKDAAGTVTIEAGKTTVLTVTMGKVEAGVSASTAIGLAVVAAIAVAVVAASR